MTWYSTEPRQSVSWQGISEAAPARVSRANPPAESQYDVRFLSAVRAAIRYTQSRSTAIMGGSKLGASNTRHAIGGADCSLGKGGEPLPLHPTPLPLRGSAGTIRPGTPT